MIVQNFTVGDVLKKPTAKLQKRDANNDLIDYNLTGLTVLFRMVLAKSPYTVKVNNAAATVVDATTGVVEYEFDSADVNTKGTYWAWFIVVSGGAYEHFPVDGYSYQINIHPDDGTKKDA